MMKSFAFAGNAHIEMLNGGDGATFEFMVSLWPPDTL